MIRQALPREEGMLLVVILAVLGSLIPTVVYVSIAWWLDRYEKEPWWLLALTFFWGAVPAIILAAISEMAVLLPAMLHDSPAETAMPGGIQPGEPLPSMVIFTMAVVAPVVEESFKAIPLLFIF